MRHGRGRSWIAWQKTLRTLRVPAGDPSDSCDCSVVGVAAYALVAEDGQSILSENNQTMEIEH
jgi:hypothetical protein